MSNASPGFKTAVKITISGTPTLVGQAKSADISANANIYDITIFGDQWKDIIPGINDYSLKIMANLDMTDTVQLALFNAWVNGTLVTWSIAPLGTSSAFSGSGYLKTIPFKFAVNAVEDVEFDLDGTGQLTWTP